MLEVHVIASHTPAQEALNEVLLPAHTASREGQMCTLVPSKSASKSTSKPLTVPLECPRCSVTNSVVDSALSVAMIVGLYSTSLAGLQRSRQTVSRARVSRHAAVHVKMVVLVVDGVPPIKCGSIAMPLTLAIECCSEQTNNAET